MPACLDRGSFEALRKSSASRCASPGLDGRRGFDPGDFVAVIPGPGRGNVPEQVCRLPHAFVQAIETGAQRRFIPRCRRLHHPIVHLREHRGSRRQPCQAGSACPLALQVRAEKALDLAGDGRAQRLSVRAADSCQLRGERSPVGYEIVVELEHPPVPAARPLGCEIGLQVNEKRLCQRQSIAAFERRLAARRRSRGCRAKNALSRLVARHELLDSISHSRFSSCCDRSRSNP